MSGYPPSDITEQLRTGLRRRERGGRRTSFEGGGLIPTKAVVLPANWDQMSEGDRVSACLNLSLDKVWKWLSLDRGDFDGAAEINAQMQCIRVVMMVAARIGVEGSRRAGEREKILARMVKELPDGKGGER